jgi:hypothetical protein
LRPAPTPPRCDITAPTLTVAGMLPFRLAPAAGCLLSGQSFVLHPARPLMLVMHVIFLDISIGRCGWMPLELEGLKCPCCIRA